MLLQLCKLLWIGSNSSLLRKLAPSLLLFIVLLWQIIYWWFFHLLISTFDQTRDALNKMMYVCQSDKIFGWEDSDAVPCLTYMWIKASGKDVTVGSSRQDKLAQMWQEQDGIGVKNDFRLPNWRACHFLRKQPSCIFREWVRRNKENLMM